MSSIDGVISELSGIRNALGQDAGEPWRRPQRGSTEAPASERVTGDPIFDSGRWEIADQRLWDEKKERARRTVEGEVLSSGRTGIEALAWYASFHDNQDNWGIYIPLSSLALSDELYLSKLPMDRDRRLRLAWSILLHHEQMHFAVDHACAWFELMLRAPIRREFMARFRAEPPLPAVTMSEAYLEIEETAANAHMLRQLGRAAPRQVVQTIESFVESQPAGYREGLDFTGDTAFAEAVAETLRSYLALWAIEYSLDLGSREMNLLRLLPLGDGNALAECPVYVLDDLADVGIAPGSVRLIQRITEIVESQSFKKQLRRQEPAVRRDWSRKKEQIKIVLPSPPRFEKLKNWEPPTWSLRLRDGHRVHLQPPDLGAAAWRAVAIGNHKEMGHG
ncbi:MAG TPA: hypothetical protein VG936_08645 [Lacunisphaera sp.]|nr:hypothetical protein [Lacunisphaera sp.]